MLTRALALAFLGVALARSHAAAAEWSRARIARLPASAFAVVEIAPHGRKVRHLPPHDETGAVDPAHLRAARARLPQVKWSTRSARPSRAGIWMSTRAGHSVLMRTTDSTAPAAQGVKTSFRTEYDPPGRGPPEITKIRPPTAAAPRPCRAVGIGAHVVHRSATGS